MRHTVIKLLGLFTEFAVQTQVWGDRSVGDVANVANCRHSWHRATTTLVFYCHRTFFLTIYFQWLFSTNIAQMKHTHKEGKCIPVNCTLNYFTYFNNFVLKLPNIASYLSVLKKNRTWRCILPTVPIWKLYVVFY